MSHNLIQLPYSYNALEPWLDAATMELHHSKHHQTYVDNLNKTLETYPDLFSYSPEELVANLNNLPVDDNTRTAIRNHGGGVVNHNFFWQLMNPANEPNQDLIIDLIATFGSLDNFKEQFNQCALKQFGSGWAWLVRRPDGQLAIYGTSNQDSPLSHGDEPILTVDVWEHAYYLKYQNRRKDYLENWWHTVKII